MISELTYMFLRIKGIHKYSRIIIIIISALRHYIYEDSLHVCYV